MRSLSEIAELLVYIRVSTLQNRRCSYVAYLDSVFTFHRAPTLEKFWLVAI